MKDKLPFNQHNSNNTTRSAGKTVFFIDWKQNKKQDKNKTKTKQKQNTTNTKNKTNIETERQKHTPWKHKQKQHKKITSRKWKQLGF